MLRAHSSTGRKSLLLLVLSAVVGAAWWWTQPHPPREPVHDGRRLSEWVFAARYSDYEVGFAQDMGGESDSFIAREHLPDYGAAGVAWLAWQVEHGRRSSPDHGPRPFERAPNWLRRWLPKRWGGLRPPADVDERMKAALALGLLEQKAAPAIPTLARCLREEANDRRLAVALALHSTGPASWPVVHDALEHGSVEVRRALMWQMSRRMGNESDQASDAEKGLIAEACVKACGDPDAVARSAAAATIGNCRGLSASTTAFDVAIPELIRLLSDPDENVRQNAAGALRNFYAKGVPAIARLIELLDDPAQGVRYQSAETLGMVDVREGRSAARLRLILKEDPNPTGRQIAAWALERFARLPGAENANEESMPAR